MTDQDTRQKILTAAAELFVEHGFQKTTIRNICSAAGVNGAAVNYHFRGKKGLYLAVIQYAMDLKPEPDDPEGASTEVRLRAWVSSLVFSCVGDEPDLLSQIMANEMTRPSEFLAFIVQEMVAPRMAQLEEIVTQGVGDSVEPERIRLLAMSVVGQALLYDHCRPVVDMMMPSMDYSPPKLEMLVDHITRASMGMIEAFRETSN